MLFARLDLLRTRTRRKKALLQLLWLSDLLRKDCQPKKEEITTNLTDLCTASDVNKKNEACF